MSSILPTSAHFPAVSPQVLHGFTKLQLLNRKSRTRTGRQFRSAQSAKLEVERDRSRDRPRRNLVPTAEKGNWPGPNVELENREAQPDHSILGNPCRARGPRMPRSEESNRGLCNYVFFAQPTDRGKDWRGRAGTYSGAGAVRHYANRTRNRPHSLWVG